MTAARTGRSASLRVLQSVPPPRGTTNPYIVQLFRALRGAGIEVRPFRWSAALLGRYDVFHVHWPENLLRGRNRRRHAVRWALTAALALRLVVLRTPVVRTVHNLGEHEPVSCLDRAVLGLLARRTRMRILLNHEGSDSTSPSVTIAHGHFRDWFEASESGVAPIPHRVAYFGLIRPYKGVEDLLEAFIRWEDPVASLVVAGHPRTPQLAESLRTVAGVDARISLDLDYVSDDRLRQIVQEAELVVLPYRALHNSGAALAALSLDRPVLVPDTPVTRSLREEVGEEWIHLFSGQLKTGDLDAALIRVGASDRSERPDLSAREWGDVGDRHRQAYEAALSR